MTHKQLERLAVAAHRRGDDWNTFYAKHAGDVQALEPWNLAARNKLVRRLSVLVAAGDLDGAEPIANSWPRPEPWELDDMAQPHPLDRGSRHGSFRAVSNI